MMALTCESIMRASGDTRTPLLDRPRARSRSTRCSAPFLIYGWGPFPRAGRRGRGVGHGDRAGGDGRGLPGRRGARPSARFPLARRAAGPADPDRRHGAGRAAGRADRHAVLGGLHRVRALGRRASAPASMAIVGIANRIEAIQFMTAVAIGIAGAALVGQNLGAGRPDRAVAGDPHRAALERCGLAGAITLVLIAVSRSAFLALFTRDPEVMRLGVPYLRILALCLVVQRHRDRDRRVDPGLGPHPRAVADLHQRSRCCASRSRSGCRPGPAPACSGIAWVITGHLRRARLLIVAWAARGTWKRGLRARAARARRRSRPSRPRRA